MLGEKVNTLLMDTPGGCLEDADCVRVWKGRGMQGGGWVPEINAVNRNACIAWTKHGPGTQAKRELAGETGMDFSTTVIPEVTQRTREYGGI